MAAPPEVNILDYGGFWLMAGEAHISTIAVRPEWRRRIGELLLVAMLDRAVELGGDLTTLEVRVSSVAAQSLYQKYGFAKVGLRSHDYRDRGEDALIMTTKHLTSVAFQSAFQRLKVVPDQIDKGNRIGYNKLDGRCLGLQVFAIGTTSQARQRLWEQEWHHERSIIEFEREVCYEHER
jgi:ribosomal-protein-alanine N-acetyltransferase